MVFAVNKMDFFSDILSEDEKQFRHEMAEVVIDADSRQSTPSRITNENIEMEPLIIMRKKFKDTNFGNTIDSILSKTRKPIVSPRTRKIIRDKAREYMMELQFRKIKEPPKVSKKRRRELDTIRNLDMKTIQFFMQHPYFKRLMKNVTREMVTRERLWRNYKPIKLYRDTETTRRRIQPVINTYFVEYALKYGKKPWRYSGRNKVKTKHFDTLDWVKNPFDVIEEKIEKEKFKDTSMYKCAILKDIGK